MTNPTIGDTPPLFGAQLMPAFHRHPEEAARIGRIVAGFGEIEFMLALCLGEALSDRDAALRAMFGLISDRSRITMASALISPIFKKRGLGVHLEQIIKTIRYCHEIRNQYAHCHYADQWNLPGLYFTNLTDTAKNSDPFEYQWRYIDVALLDLQQAYFLHAMQCLQYLEWEYQFKTRKIRRAHHLPWPKELERPPKHNLPSQHIPPWLNPEQKQRHLERAEEWERSAGLRPPIRQPRKAPKLSARQRRERAMRRAAAKKR